MNWSLLLQQLVAYCVASFITFLATRYHLTQEQQGLISTDVYGGIGFVLAAGYGLWTHHRAYLMIPKGADNAQQIPMPTQLSGTGGMPGLGGRPPSQS